MNRESQEQAPEPRKSASWHKRDGISGTEPEWNVPVPERDLTLGRFLSELRHRRDIQGGDQPAAIGSGHAVDQDRLLHLAQDLHELGETLLRELPLCRHAEVDKIDAQPPSLSEFRIIPGAPDVLAAQIDDRFDAVAFLIVGDQLGSRLRGSVELTGN